MTTSGGSVSGEEEIVERQESPMSAARKYLASMYQICREKADSRAKNIIAGIECLSCRSTFSNRSAPSFMYGDNRYRNTDDEARGGIDPLRISYADWYVSSSSSSLEKSKGVLLDSSGSCTRISADAESRPESLEMELSDALELVDRRRLEDMMVSGLERHVRGLPCSTIQHESRQSRSKTTSNADYSTRRNPRMENRRTRQNLQRQPAAV
jgi:hypothetical protein